MAWGMERVAKIWTFPRLVYYTTRRIRNGQCMEMVVKMEWASRRETAGACMAWRTERVAKIWAFSRLVYNTTRRITNDHSTELVAKMKRTRRREEGWCMD